MQPCFKFQPHRHSSIMCCCSVLNAFFCIEYDLNRCLYLHSTIHVGRSSLFNGSTGLGCITLPSLQVNLPEKQECTCEGCSPSPFLSKSKNHGHMS